MRVDFGTPAAVARVRGETVRGEVRFYQTPEGVLVAAEIRGLPASDKGFFAFHIHEGGDCGGVNFADAGSHFNPGKTTHPRHAGDLPPLLSDGGNAFLAVLTNRFRVEDVIGRTTIIHAGADDFNTQPSGNAGKMIACGVIGRVYG